MKTPTSVVQVMSIYRKIPWQLKIVAKVVMSRIPLSYRSWSKVGVFNLGGMEKPEYALGVFRRHFDAVKLARSPGHFVGLELGPGDSLASALICRALGGVRTYLVDVGPFARRDVPYYRRLENSLRALGLQPPNLASCLTFEDVMAACSAEYLTGGLDSLRSIPSGAVDFVWSHAVLQHVRLKDFLPTLSELRRVQRSDGVGSHCVSTSDILSGELNDLRFSRRIWESPLMANSGFYTNRLRYEELLRMFRLAGFDPQVQSLARWRKLPLARRKMAQEFAMLTEEELLVSGFDVLLH